MAKAGRKRKNVLKREKNGKPQRGSRAGERDRVMTVALEQRRRRGLEGEAARDNRAESPLGRMLLTGRLSEGGYLAGERLRARRAAALVELARPVVLAEFCRGADGVAATPGPRAARSPGSGMVANTLRSEDAAHLVENRSDRPETPHERAERVRGQWGEAQAAALEAAGGSRAGFRLVLRVACELVEPMGETEEIVVRMALARLAKRWGLDEDGQKGDPGLRGLRLSLDGAEAWRFPNAKNRGKALQGA